MGIFSWLRNAAKQAILGGIQDAYEELKNGNPQYLESTPAIEDAPSPKRGKKAEAA